MELKRFIFNPVDVNCYILWNESKEAVIIDGAVLFDEEKEELKNFIKNNGLTVKYHLNTHLHFDHIFGNPFIEQAFGIKSAANDKDWPWAETIGERVARFGLKYNEKIPAIGSVLHDGDTVTFGNNVIKALHVPGHSPGSLAYYVAEENMLFSGDALFRGSIGRTDFADADYDTLISSIKEKLLSLPDATLVFPGHGDHTTIGFEKQYNRFLL
ncbi:MAG: MBL fold metallo-hydrolase [Bacteroidales bacterium]|nr:MBL fold metallo-hydrolase [Bacteroidales bacterium]MBR2607083.1 MBL fold metallo-hydrolase [Bacteroidaceae bacterium]